MVKSDGLPPSLSPSSLPSLPPLNQATFDSPPLPTPRLSRPSSPSLHRTGNEAPAHGLYCLRFDPLLPPELAQRTLGRSREGGRAQQEDVFEVGGDASSVRGTAVKDADDPSLSDGWEEVEDEDDGWSLAGSTAGEETTKPPLLSPLPSSLNSSPTQPLISILASKIFDSVAMSFKKDRVITVDTASGLILSVDKMESFGISSTSEVGPLLRGGKTLDLRHLVLVPGFVDAHVHLFLHAYSETVWQDQVLRESLVERTVRAVTHAEATLLAGFTTVRDLGTEGALDGDVHLRASLSPPLSLSPSPRIFISTRAIVSTGSYGPRTQKWDDPGFEEEGRVVGAEVADGVDEIVRVVRRQIGRGADWIKIYADYPTRSSSAAISPRLGSQGFQVFTFEEMAAAVRTAKGLGVKVAAHATRAETIKDCVRAGVSTIEHGYDADREAFKMMKDSGVIWVPTLAAYSAAIMLLSKKVSLSQAAAQINGNATHLREEMKELRLAEDRWERMKRAFKLGLEVGVKIACGGDTGVFSHGLNSLEMRRMLSLGASVPQVLSWCTNNGFLATRAAILDDDPSSLQEWSRFASQRHQALTSSLGVEDAGSFLSLGPGDAGTQEQPFGRIEGGFAADLVGLRRDSVDGSFGKFVKGVEKVEFVMKGGRVYKAGGREVIE